MSAFLAALRRLLAVALCFSFLGTLTPPAFAAGGQTGNLNGTIVDATTKAGVAGVSVAIASPSQTLTATTDGKGFFQLNGIPADTYSVRFRSTGYQDYILSGVTVTGDQTVSLGTQTLQKALQTIGRSAARSVTSAFQPTQTIDQTTVSGTRALIASGKALATNENDLALSVPGVVLDNAGALIIRGGLRSEVGYQLDGVPITEPFLGGNGTNGFYNGLASLQVVAGNGDASQGNVGAGVINIVPKRGTNPSFGTGDIEIGGPNFNHQTSVEYGFASKDGRFSDYISYAGQRYVPYYGYSNTDAANFGNIDATSYAKNDDILNNFIFRFGKNNNQSIKIIADLRDYQQFGDLGGLAGRVPYYNNPYFYAPGGGLVPAGPPDPIANAQFLTSVFPILPFSPVGNQGPQSTSPIAVSPSRFFEAEYDNNLDANTYLQLKTFNFSQLNTNTNYYPENTSGFGNAAYNSTGGSQVGVKLDITRTIGDKNTLTFGVSEQNNHPIWTGILAGDSAYLLSAYYQGGAAGAAPSLADFATPVNGACPVANGCYLYNALGGQNPGPIPSFGINYNKTDFQILSAYLRDQIRVTDKLKLDLGLREDLENWKQGANPYNPDLSNPDDLPLGGNANVGGSNYLRYGVVHPRIFQPRAAINYEIDRYNAVAASFGTSTIFPNAQTLGTPGAMYNVPAAFNSIAPLPGTNTADPSTWSCGSGYNAQYLTANKANASSSGGAYFRCTSYAQQLYWLYDQNFDAPDAGNNTPPLEVDKDITYSHLFKNGLGLRSTVYYDRSFNVPQESIISQVLNSQGVPISQVFGVTNTGTKKVSGAEFSLTTRDVQYGFNAFLSATYTNVLNSVPPLVGSEDVLPLVPVASIKLGDVYRAGYVSPFTIRAGGQYKFKNGLRINPVLQYDRGYPTGVGNVIATQYPGGFANLPQTNGNAPTYSGFGGITGAFNATNYVDATNPGTLANPNIAATRGTPETSAAGGFLTHPRLTANVTLEYQFQKKNALGFQVFNLFGNVYSEPVYNPYYQPVATGVAGPATGTTNAAVPGSLTYTYGGFRNIPIDVGGNGAFIRLPTAPVSFRLYFQRSL
jgi:hypothetical protein